VFDIPKKKKYNKEPRTKIFLTRLKGLEVILVRNLASNIGTEIYTVRNTYIFHSVQDY
jgi:hypothetical protein